MCCERGEVVDVEHLVLKCKHVKEERGKLMELMDERVEGWLGMEENERVAVAMDKACRSSSREIESYAEIMAEEVYIANGSHPSTRS